MRRGIVSVGVQISIDVIELINWNSIENQAVRAANGFIALNWTCFGLLPSSVFSTFTVPFS
jgi:spore maturation protein SpmA